MQGKAKECSGEEGKTDRYVKIFAALEQALGEGSATALTKPLRTQLKVDRERLMSAVTRRKEVVVAPRLLSMLSSTPSEGSPTIVTVPSTLPWTTPLDVAVSSPVPPLS